MLVKWFKPEAVAEGLQTVLPTRKPIAGDATEAIQTDIDHVV